MKMNKKIIFPILAVVIIILAAALIARLRAPGGYSGPTESITLGAQISEVAIPLFVAQDQGFFEQNGLAVTVKAYDTGLKALNGMLNGEVDVVATVSEYVMVGKILDNQPVKTIGILDKIDFVSIVARKDRGIERASELRGKRVGVLLGTNIEFFLGRFLELHRINAKDVTSVDIGTYPHSVDAVVSGKVDAVLCVPPYDKVAQSQLGNNAVVFPAQSGQLAYTLIVCGSEWLKLHSNVAERFLKAMNQAERYMIQHPQESRAIAKRKLNLTDDDITKIWLQNEYSLTLDQSLITAMEEEARWMIKNKLTREKTIPDFTNYIYVDGLNAIKPEAVNIIR